MEFINRRLGSESMGSSEADSGNLNLSDVTVSKNSEGHPHAGQDGDIASPDRAKRLWKKVKYQLVEYHALPEYLRDNEYILRYYRPEWPIKQVLLSMFTIHNETLNVWTDKATEGC